MIRYLAVALILASCQGRHPIHPLSDEFIDKVNSLAKTWKAGRNFAAGTSMRHLRKLMGVLPSAEDHLPPLRARPIPMDSEAPEEFDAREEWPNCKSLREIRDQGSCGSCWAISSVAVMTDRTCIQSRGQTNFHFSTEDLMSCCENCGQGCNGGWPGVAFRYWRNHGIVSGGLYGSNEGCKPYSIPPCAHHVETDRPECNGTLPTPQCKADCQKNYDEYYENDLHFAEERYTLSDESSIISDLINNGPVVASFTVYEDFLQYKSGVYEHVHGSSLGGHAIKIIGYGVEDGVKYWLCANSWNTDWGDKGYFKILRGVNECNIEGSIVAGNPKL